VIAEMLAEPIYAGMSVAMKDQILRDSDTIAAQLTERTGEDVAVNPTISEDSAAMKFLKQRAETASIAVQDDIRSMLGTILTDAAENDYSINQLTQALDTRIPEIGHAKSRLIARTEIMHARRQGAQALADSLDVIGGKMWDATRDSRTRAWHAAMDGAVVPKDGYWTVPLVDAKAQKGQGFPKDTYIVGGTDPWNCRCVQRHVLREDMPDNIQELCARYPEVVQK